jgi:hypothetical protein
MSTADDALVRDRVAREAEIDAICDRFEDACRADRRPPIDEFLKHVGIDPGSADLDLLRELTRVNAAYAEAEGQLTQSNTISYAQSSTTFQPAANLKPDSSLHLPGYEILEVVGIGGMGIVYRARHLALNRIVAIKMIRFAGQPSEADSARFQAEAAAIARLQHRNVVQVYEIGTHQGLPYICLEFCGGGSLRKKLAGTPLPPREAARLTLTLAKAVHAVHQKGIIHRDLKPANVLLAEDGSPKIADFGLVKTLGEMGETITGAILGTPSYMAPEQASGRSKDVGPACDVYALGAILYELLVGRPPFAGASVTEVLDQVRHYDPVPPRRVRGGLDPDLDTICLTCLSKQPDNRYASANDLVEDLERFLAGAAVKARPMSLAQRVAKVVGQTGLIREFHASGWLHLVTGAVFAGAHTSVFFALLFSAPEWAVWPTATQLCHPAHGLGRSTNLAALAWPCPGIGDHASGSAADEPRCGNRDSRCLSGAGGPERSGVPGHGTGILGPLLFARVDVDGHGSVDGRYAALGSPGGGGPVGVLPRANRLVPPAPWASRFGSRAATQRVRPSSTWIICQHE